MEYRTLGSTGTVVSTLCLGTMTFGAESDEQVAHEQLDRFVEQGGNFVDTADVYADGESEAIIGRWLAARSGRATRWWSPPRRASPGRAGRTTSGCPGSA
jgi:aryl-alcohol dehydrogenase-like predicted oxidoreductase